MENFGYGAVQIIPSMRGFSASMNRELGQVMPQAGRQAGEQLGSGVESGFSKSVAGLGQIAKRGVQTVGVALATAVVAAGKWGLSLASANEQADISFTTMLGSAEAAGSFLEGLRDFAASTPFEFPELQTAASSLISAGIEASKVIPIMTSLGDATSGMGTGAEGVKRATVALQQMNAAGRITGEDLNQLRDAGIPVYDLLAAATGKSKEEVAGLAQAGKLGREELTQLMDALESGKGLERFSGLMAEQAESLAGLGSTMKDVYGQKLATYMEPALERIKEILPAATEAGDVLLDRLAPALAGAIGSGAELIPGLLTGLENLAARTEDLLAPLDGVGGRWRDLATDARPLVRELGDSLLPIIEDLVDIAADAMPLAFAASGSSLTVMLRGATLLANVIEPLTGFLADHEVVVGAVAAAYGAWMLQAKVGAAVTALQAAVSGSSAAFALQEVTALAASRGVSVWTATMGVARASAAGFGAQLLTMPRAGAVAKGAFLGIAAGLVVLIQGLDKAHEQARTGIESLKPPEFDARSIDSLIGYQERLGSAIDDINEGRDAGNRFVNNLKGAAELMTPMENSVLDAAIAAGDYQKAFDLANEATMAFIGQVNGIASATGLSSTSIERWIQKLDLDPASMSVEHMSTAIDSASSAARNGSPAVDQMAGSLEVLADETSSSTDRIKAWSDQIHASVDAATGNFDAITGVRGALRELTMAFAVNGSDLEGNTKEVDANRDALSGAVQAALDVAVSQGEMSGSAEQAALVLAQQREALINAGLAAGTSREKMEDYLDAMGLTEEVVTTAMDTSQVDGAKVKVAQLDEHLKAMDGTEYRAAVKLSIDDGGLAGILELLDPNYGEQNWEDYGGGDRRGGSGPIVGGQHEPKEGNGKSLRILPSMPNGAAGTGSIAPVPATNKVAGTSSAGGKGLNVEGDLIVSDQRTAADLDMWSQRQAQEVAVS